MCSKRGEDWVGVKIGGLYKGPGNKMRYVAVGTKQSWRLNFL